MGKFNPEEHFMNLKGKAYLEVKWRLVWFREDHPDWQIKTQLVSYDNEAMNAIFRAEIIDSDDRALSSGYGSESRKDFNDFVEKAETKAVGRALAMLGYGTQFAPELEEGERIVDAPVDFRKAKAPEAPKSEPVHINPVQSVICECCGQPITDYKNKSAKELEIYSVAHYGQRLCGKCIVKAAKNANS